MKQIALRPVTFIFSVFFAFLAVLQSKIHFEDISQELKPNTFIAFVPQDILHFILFWGLFWILLTIFGIMAQQAGAKFGVKISTPSAMQNDEEVSSRKRRVHLVFWVVFLLDFSIDIIFLLTSYLGSMLPDTFSSVSQAMGTAPYSNHHPILFTLLIQFFIFLGIKLFHSMSAGIFLFCVLQSILYSVTIGYFVAWMYKQKLPTVLVVITAAFYLANMIFANYAINVQKDALFAVFLFWMMLFLLHMQGKEMAFQWGELPFFVLQLSLTAFFRNNGIYIDWILVVLLLICYRKKIATTAKAILLLAMISFTVIQGPVYQAFGLKNDSDTAETYGVPLQQIGYVVKTDGEMDESDKAFLAHILPMEKWEADYHPFIVDPIKWDESFNGEFLAEHKKEFIQTWLHIMKNNFPGYCKAYILDTFGFWSFGTHSSYGYSDNYVGKNSFGFVRTDKILEWTGIDLSASHKILFPDAGTLFWLMLLSVYLIWLTSGPGQLFFLLPAILSWLTIMLAAPVAFSLRYVFVLALALPFYMTAFLLTGRLRS
ncbi:MAG: DUF6020 family protein [Eubacterium sp.]|nr:DUF6020 family protein [Eubacterium sp.]